MDTYILYALVVILSVAIFALKRHQGKMDQEIDDLKKAMNELQTRFEKLKKESDKNSQNVVTESQEVAKKSEDFHLIY